VSVFFTYLARAWDFWKLGTAVGRGGGRNQATGTGSSRGPPAHRVWRSGRLVVGTRGRKESSGWGAEPRTASGIGYPAALGEVGLGRGGFVPSCGVIAACNGTAPYEAYGNRRETFSTSPSFVVSGFSVRQPRPWVGQRLGWRGIREGWPQRGGIGGAIESGGSEFMGGGAGIRGLVSPQAAQAPPDVSH